MASMLLCQAFSLLQKLLLVVFSGTCKKDHVCLILASNCFILYYIGLIQCFVSKALIFFKILQGNACRGPEAFSTFNLSCLRDGALKDPNVL